MINHKLRAIYKGILLLIVFIFACALGCTKTNEVVDIFESELYVTSPDTDNDNTENSGISDSPLSFEMDPVEFFDATQTDKKYGFPTTARTNNAQYFFSFGSKTEKTDLVKKAEIMFLAADSFGIQRPSMNIWFYFVEGDENQYMDIQYTRTTAVLDPNNQASTGAMLFTISGGKLPAWLCAGLEFFYLDLYDIDTGVSNKADSKSWHEECMAKDLPLFADEWLVPGLIEDGLSQNVHAIALSFVKYLCDTESLSELVNLYIDEATIFQAEQKRVDKWNMFVGEKDPILIKSDAFVFKYLYRQNGNELLRLSRALAEYTFICNITTAQGNYFLTAGEWTLDRVNHNVRFSDDAYGYVRGWFDVDNDVKLSTILEFVKPDKINPAFYVPTRDVIILYATDGRPVGAAHEATHAIIRRLEIESDFPYISGMPANHFEEGLAVALAYLHMSETICERSAAEAANTLYSLLNDLTDTDPLNDYKQLAFTLGCTPGRIDAKAAADTIAIYALRHLEFDFSENMFFLSPDETLRQVLDLRLPAIESGRTGRITVDLVASFVLYLLEQESSERDFLRVYADLDLMEECYGEDIYGMFVEWLTTLLTYT